MALKRELFTFLNNEDIALRATEIVEEFKQEINEDEEGEEDEEDEEDEEEDEEEDDEEDEKNNLNITNDTEEFKTSECKCDICVEINNYTNNWKSWKPSNNIEQILYNGIQKIDLQFNLI